MGKFQKSRKSKESLKKRTSSSTINERLPDESSPYLVDLPAGPPCDDPPKTEPSKSESISRPASRVSSSSSPVHALPVRQGWPLPPGLPVPKIRPGPNPRPQINSLPSQGRNGSHCPRSKGHKRGINRQMPPRPGPSDYAPRYAVGAVVDPGVNWSRHGNGVGSPAPFGMMGYPDCSAGPGVSRPSPAQLMFPTSGFGCGEIGSMYLFQDLQLPQYQQQPHFQQQPHYQQYPHYPQQHHYQQHQQEFHQRQHYQHQLQQQQQHHLMNLERAAIHDYPSPKMQTEYPRAHSTGHHRRPLNEEICHFGPSASQLHHIDRRLQRHEADQLSNGALRADAPAFVPTEVKEKKELVYPFIVHG
ncbi:hypothetical protein BDW42DRAFT_187011 [Aspergillus taichungensis]|uniref:Uncharacterized protein n=1 Tax=Aspergillus taichungensis TaxID=482145 RepID=A0A2J5HP34_9EURO|nr:hypothetical protein BDW42DRAFT_187011 [Aspergillus taichungensis]